MSIFFNNIDVSQKKSNKMSKIIKIISSYEEKKYFFTTDHCQDHGLGDTYIPASYNIGMTWHNKCDVVSVFYQHMDEIPNPNPEYKPLT